ncbi:protoporphyrinogen/coproporphyrinogen oxidase [Oceanisphaera arctica]|uniref:LPS biosynthesis protein n=1 Tax=Oceanisphaera arctica TaxID=641510 RepID=A0A2P5TK79_9GAMM|nr:NAD(P)-binding protein [Oceanisphaera arctica]PPL15520.1 LPS biosynthesis protein [Oceanisphaera arctica]GHA27609.1 O-antigen synthesis protein WbyH [Oceanisphaera arctica]
MNTVRCKHLIIGGGVSGLMFANENKEKDILLVEKEKELGGYCRTIHQDGFIWDYAGHFFHFSNDEIKKFFQGKISNDSLVYKKKVTNIFYKDNVIDFPFQTNIHQLDKSDFIDCLYDLFFKEEKEDYESFLDMLYGKFGRSITEMFLKPYNEKLYACDLNKLDQDAMGRFFPYANLEQIIKSFKKEYQGSYNATFLYPKNGAKVFVDALAEDIPSSKILMNEKVISVDVERKCVVTDKREIFYEFLINTMPLNLLLESIDKKSHQNFTSKLSWNKVLVFNLGFNKSSKFDDVHWAYFPEGKYNFYRVGFYNNILDHERLSLYVEIGCSPESTVDEQSALDKVLQGLRQAGIIDETHQLQSYCSIVMNPAYVHVDSQLHIRKEEIKSQLESVGVYTVGRYGDWKYCSIEDSMLDAISVSKKLEFL